MDLRNVSRDTMYLMVGDDLQLMDGAAAFRTETCGVEYFVVDDACVIEGSSRFFCSCNSEVCWHILKAATDPDIRFKHSTGLNR